ncbi:MAG: helicase-exonuclease AddAB subunit AddA [Oscillospiraceae bacterium]|nr:helicase-exonuclease AddAB subunit AddA [Oscillospiraceae bacterium]
MSRSWTTAQKQAITARGGTLLVSAAAGSGKTAVLIERLARLLTDPDNPAEIGSLLVVTFTKAAAAEMKQRLSEALAARLAEDPGNRQLQKQLLGLPRAKICTIHSFCADLLRDHFHLLGISPVFRIAEDTQSGLLRAQALADVMEEQYAADSPEFTALTDLLCTGRDDRAVYEAVEKLYTFTRSHPFPDRWLDQKLAAYQPGPAPDQTVWGKIITEHAVSALQYAAALCKQAVSRAMSDLVIAQYYLPALEEDLRQLTAAAERLPDAGWDEARELLGSVEFGTLKAIRKSADMADDSCKEKIKELRTQYKKQTETALRGFCCSAAEFSADLAATASGAAALCGLVRQFSDRYATLKSARRLLDFDDLEHMALRLLVEESEENLQQTPLAKQLAEQFSYVMVDEYQDTNAAQDALFTALSRPNNLFMVGDVKQSIYSFRKAMPEIFIKKTNTFTPYTDDMSGDNCQLSTVTCQLPPGSLIRLGHNFRSRPQVTEAVNFVFSQLMSRESSGIAYNEGEELVAAAEYPAAEGRETELILIDGAAGDEDAGPDTAEEAGTAESASDAARYERAAVEARVIAEKINAMLRVFRVTEGSGDRPVRYQDFCVLLRSTQGYAAAYAAELARLGIPAWTESRSGFFAAAEVTAAVSLLRVIDNPVQDVPLLAVMLSPVFGFTPDDLAAVRLAQRGATGANLFVALRRYAARKGTEDDLSGRITGFLRRLDGWRALAAAMPADRLIWRIYEDCGLPAVMSAKPGAAERTGNLRKLQELAREFEDDGFRGLSAFVRHLDRMEERQMDIAPSAAGTAYADVVRIISIHHSKGLEFPVVFLAGLGSRFNDRSAIGDLLLDEEAGIGLIRRDADTRQQYETVSHRGVSLSIRRQQRREEMRILYVAMTRAREKLIMVMSVNNATAKLSRLAAALDNRPQLPAYAAARAAGPGDWLLSAALRHPSADILRMLAGGDPVPLCPAIHDWQIVICRPPELPAELTDIAAQFEADQALCRLLAERMAWEYPWLPLGQVPVKLAASELAAGGISRAYAATSRPAFLGAGGLTPAERGTALHQFMQFADYGAAETDPAAEAARLVSGGYLTAAQGASLPLVKIRRFFAGPLYRRIKAADSLRREAAFTVEMPVTAYAPELAQAETTIQNERMVAIRNERMVVQGIADCVFEENGGLIIVDYKTDHVKTAEELMDRYRRQLEVYRWALARTLGLPVTGCLLYSFALDREIPVTGSAPDDPYEADGFF